MKAVPQADAKSASMGWFFDPGFIQNVQRIAADVENPSMESIDSVLFALREMGYIRTAETCEHGFSVDECVEGMCELQTENALLRSRVARLEDALRSILGWRELRDTMAFPVKMVEDVARRALEEKSARLQSARCVDKCRLISGK